MISDTAGDEPGSDGPAATVQGSVPRGGHLHRFAAFLAGLGGILAVACLFPGSPWSWTLWIAVGAAMGAILGRGRSVWVAWSSVLACYLVTSWLGLPGDTGRFWVLGVIVRLALVGVGFAAGTSIGWRPGARARAARSWAGLPRGARRLLIAVVAAAALGGASYVAYAGIYGSDVFVHANVGIANCENPRHGFGWAYEAINYDAADDRALEAANRDMARCASQGASAGDEIASRDGVHLAGFYVPAASGAGPTGPTIVLVPGWKTNKSDMLKYAVPLHASYNVVVTDLRGVGRSAPAAETTMGLRERLDVQAMVDWLERTKHPRSIVLMGCSMGGATAVAEAVTDPRIAALILDSMHAHEVTTIGAILENEHGNPSVPGSWAIVLGASIRLGTDVTTVDPARTIPELGDRPVLLIHGTADVIDAPSFSAEVNFKAALDAGVPVELHYCQGGTHGRLLDDCPDEWARWTQSFLAWALADG